ncbi:MAG TPA: Fic family protein [Solirubrobacterales bacterium]|nr:Fic family protein [Solirubrobacterales bacterium]
MIERLQLADFLLIAEAVLGTPARGLIRVVQIPAAESALAAPFASFGGIDFYPDPVERAAICCSRIIRNHPLPDGNKRLGYECMREMLERVDAAWPRPSEDVDEIASAIEELAASRLSERDFVAWVKRRVELGRREI